MKKRCFAVVVLSWFLSACFVDEPKSTTDECETRKAAACAVQADCFSDMCTASECVDGACVHAMRSDGITCIGTHPPKDTFFGSCLCGACIEFDQ